LNDVVNEETVAATGLFHWAPVNQMMRDHFDRRANHGYPLWGLLNLMLWLRRWRVTAG
jgi:asparagine synthase (glutamine-hydrolysing)